MFKVQENGDGTTSIFCRKSGAFICKLNNQKKNMGVGGRPRPVNVVGPSPQPRLSLDNLEIISGNSSDEEETKSKARKAQDIPPLPDEVKEDYYDDCITPEEFARALNLVPTKKFKETPLEQLKSTFPLRHYPRTKPAQISEDVNDIKILDDLPLTSSFGVKVLKLNLPKNFYNEQTMLLKIKHYDSYCRFQLNTQSVCNNFPKLRCREKKEYPVSSYKIPKTSYFHTYAFNRKQRLEKMITFKTGLNKRSRRLLQQCTKKLSVRCERLSSKEIEFWLSKKSGIVRPITEDCIKDEDPLPPTVIDIASDSSDSSSSDSDSSSSSAGSDYSPKIVSFKGVLNRPNHFVSLSVNNSNSPYSKVFKNSHYPSRNCCVRLSNVLNRVCKYGNNYYVSGTQIRIPYLAQYFDTLSSNFKVVNRMFRSDPTASSSSTNLPFDHAYHLPLTISPSLKKKCVARSLIISKSPKSKKKVVNRSFNMKDNTKDNFKNKSRPPLQINTVNVQITPLTLTPVKNLEIIPIIDLTDEMSPKKQNASSKVLNDLLPSWIFQCYGCKHKRAFFEEGDVKLCGIEHMRKFHCVSDPQPFLSLSRTSCGGVLEAFPGYKESCK